ncbi:MAG: nucleotidyltransferase family protein, partial [Planctomycetales bacterium]|nr:nucleotidyltransferase family protein [Planctomycetales bacterium]
RLEIPAYLPSASQKLLLDACLLDTAAARLACEEWDGSTDDGKFDAGATRLFPFLASRIDELELTGELAGQLRLAQRNAWVQSQIHTNVASQVIELLDSSGIKGILLKGAALSNYVYASPRLRPSADIDLLVEREEISRALELCVENGWISDLRFPNKPVDFVAGHAVTLVSPAPHIVELDVHWRITEWTNCEVALQQIRARALSIGIAGKPAFAIGPADCLVHICAHGANWNEISPIRWVADAVMLLRRTNIDWDHLLAQSERLKLTLQMRATLGFLVDEYGVQVPDHVLDALSRREVPEIEKFIYTLGTLPLERRSFLVRVRLHLWRCRHMLGRSPLIPIVYFLRRLTDHSPREAIRWLTSRIWPGWIDR